jgi:chemosensory pili system protein ChpA (sensor histidine kinase/response regulator)
MDNSQELDIGPLTWVKGEIDLALERALEALGQHGDDVGDSSFLKSARSHLHQAYGALSIVGLEGVTRFAEVLEQLLAAVEGEELHYTPAVAAAARQGIAAIRHYLEDLVSGQPDQPLRLLPSFRALVEARGAPTPAPSELFFPDMSLRPPRRPREPEALPADQARMRLRAARSGFQRGLLKWLREDPRGVREMREYLMAIEILQPQGSRAFWWCAVGFVDAIAAGTLPLDFNVRRLCARVDTQIKKLIDGSRTVAERLMRDTLYYVAVAGPASEHAEAIRKAYRLAALIPEPAAGGDIEPLRPLLRGCREQLTAAMDDWNRFCAGTAAALPQFHDHLRHLVGQIGDLGQNDLARLARLVLEATDALRRAPLGHNEALGLEMATALLLMQDALASFQRLGPDFSEQVDTVAHRLTAAQAGEPLSAMDMPHLDRMSRRAQERLLMAQVVKEIQVNLSTIEQALDAFFRDQTKTAELPNLNRPLKQIEGALLVLGQDRAVAVLQECEALIGQFSHENYVPSQGDFEGVATKLAGIGFFAEKLQHGPADIDAILNPGLAPAAEEVIDEPSVEDELDAARRLTKSLVFALRSQPEDEGLRGEIKQSLEVVRENAQLVDDIDLVAQANAAIVALESDEASGKIEAAIADIAPTKTESVVAPSAEAARLAEATTEEIDAELLDIFIEEAHEVLGTIASLHPQLAAHPHDRDTLTTVRRSFHTLKGSGRMVGLADLGEAAWAVEKVLNRWLQQELQVTPALSDMIGNAHEIFAAWVQRLEAGEGLHYDTVSLVDQCEQLMGSDGSEAPVAAAAGAPQTVAPEAVAEASAAVASIVTPADAAPTVGSDEFVETEPGAESAAVLTEAEPTPQVAAPVLRLVQPAPEPVAVGDLLLSPTLYELYVNESRTHIETLSREINLPGVPQHPLVRAAHTLASISATAGFTAVNRLGHALEMVLTRLADANRAPDDDRRLVMARTVGALEGMVGAIAERRLPTGEEPLAAQLDAMAAELAPPAADLSGDEIVDELGPEGVEEIVLTELPADDLDELDEIDEIDAEAQPGVPDHALLETPAAEPSPPEPAEASEPMTAVEPLEVAEPATPAEPAEAAATPAAPEIVEAIATDAPEALLAAESAAAVTAEDQVATESVVDQPAPVPIEVAEPTPTVVEAPPAPAVPPLADVPAVPTADAGTESDRRQLRLQDEIDPQLLPIFLEEAVDLMRDIGSDLRTWRHQPSDGSRPDHLKRALHTLKGSARMAGAMSVGELVHSMESRIEEAVAANAVSPAFLDTLDASYDRASSLIEILQGAKPADVVVEEEVAPPTPATPAAQVADGTMAPRPAVVAAPAADVRHDMAEAEGAKAVLRVRADVVDKLVNEAGEIAIARGRIEAEMRTLKGALLDLTENVIRLRKQLREVEIQAETQMQSRQAMAAESNREFDPLEFDRFTRFQELTRMMAESVNDVATAQQGLLQNLDHADAAITAQARLNRELSQALMGVRMVPFNTLAERLYRIVRQTAKETAKRANLDIRGGQTELDRSVLEKMTGPIEHLLRNAVAHGIESPDRRHASGKADIGEIGLHIAHEGNEVVIELSDDGAGIDLEAVRRRAVADGLLADGDQPAAEQLTQLIFRPGFSTASELTAYAGRGVGMDVVRNEAANLGGRIEVITTTGQGTRFRIYLPLTLAITQAVLVRVGTRHYAIPSSMVAQVSELRPQAIAAIRAEGATTWLGDRYAWHYLPNLLGDAAARPDDSVRRHWLLLLRAGNQHVALEVDDLVGNQELVVKNVGPQLARVVGIAGATVLGDGEISLIINPIALAGRSARVAAAPAVAAAQPAAPAQRAGTVMVVDDSLTVRKITGRLLAREGYHVLTAKDGVEALEQLLDVTPDVMLVDIEMPRMDGFDLTRNVRADERLRSIPIIMITSRIADKHRNYAMEIGVNHYLGKPYDEEQLLELISGYVQHH